MRPARRGFRDRLPLVLSSTALVVAVFGATPLGEAALNAIPRASVGTDQLKANAVTSAKVKDRTLRSVDFAVGALPAGAQGAKGDPGPKGDAGPRTPSWGDAAGPGFGADFSAWKELGQKLTLARTDSGRYFVFGKLSVDLTCGTSVCSQSYGLFLNGVYVPLTNSHASAPANGRARSTVTVFGVGTLPQRPTTSPVLSLRYHTFGPLKTASVGASLGAIALG
jgi:hypothetical protein